MSEDYFGSVERQLAGLCRQGAHRSRWRRPRLSVGADVTHVAGVALSVLVVLAVVGLALGLNHGSPRSSSSGPTGAGPSVSGPPPAAPAPLLPAHPSRRQAQEVNYLHRAETTAFRHDSACEPQQDQHPTISQGSPSPGLLAILGVLRRPAQPTDKLPVRVTYHPYKVASEGSLPPAKDIYIRYIRRARWRFGAGYYIVPAGDVNPTSPIPTRCYAQQRAALERELPQIPKQLRAPTLALEPRFLDQLRYSATPHPGVCLLALNSGGGGDVDCGDTASSIEQGHSTGSGGPTGVGVFYGIVPDGVASVTFYYPGHYPGHPVTALAISNVFILRNPGQRLPNYGFPQRIVWRSAQGTVIKTIHESG